MLPKKKWIYRVFCKHTLKMISWNVMDPKNRGVKYQCLKCGAIKYSR